MRMLRFVSSRAGWGTTRNLPRVFASRGFSSPAAAAAPVAGEKEETDRSTTSPTKLPPPPSRDSLWRLLELSRKEWPLIGASAATLGVTSSVTLLLPYASGAVIDYTMAAEAGGASPITLAAGLFGLNALSAGGVYLRTLWLSKAGNTIVARLKQDLYANLLKQDPAWLDRQTTGDLLSRLTADAQLVQSAVTTQAVAGIRGIVMSVGSAGMLLWVSPTLAALSGLTLPPVFVLSRRFGRSLAQQQKEVQALLGEATTLAEESLSAAKAVQQNVAEDHEARQYRNTIAAAHRRAVGTAHSQARLESGTHLSGNAAVLMVLGYGGTMVLEGAMTAGDLAGFVMYSFLMAGNLSSLASVYSDLVRAAAASDRILSVLDRTPAIISPATATQTATRRLPEEEDPLADVDDRTDAYPLTGETAVVEEEAPRAPRIEIENLDFAYPSRPDVPVLKGLSLTIEPGEVLALVGGSGSGKSTVGSLLTRLYDPKDPSTIKFDGTPLADHDLDELRQSVGVVPQDPVLFRGTIEDNIRYGAWDTATPEHVRSAARQASVLEFSDGFPDGLGTHVGSRGLRLSGGQKQRVALARVLAKKRASVLILDEATSALDARSEHLVQKALEDLFREEGGRRTILSIAHRLSTIRHASRIAVVQDGRIVQTGTFDELRSTDGPFRELMKTQLVGDGGEP